MLTYVLPKNGHRYAIMPETLNETGHTRIKVSEYVYENNAITDLSSIKVFANVFQKRLEVHVYDKQRQYYLLKREQFLKLQIGSAQNNQA